MHSLFSGSSFSDVLRTKRSDFLRKNSDRFFSVIIGLHFRIFIFFQTQSVSINNFKLAQIIHKNPTFIFQFV